MSIPSPEEINEVIDKCADASENGSAYPNMTYEDGVRAALEWMNDWSDDLTPFD